MSNITVTVPAIGTCVRTKTWNHQGVITKLHVGCPEPRFWVRGQQVPIRDEALAPDYPWVSILNHGGGSVVVPLYDIETVAPYEVNNPYVGEHLRWTGVGYENV